MGGKGEKLRCFTLLVREANERARKEKAARARTPDGSRISPALRDAARKAEVSLGEVEAEARRHLEHVGKCFPEGSVMEPVRVAESIRSVCVLHGIGVIGIVMAKAISRDEPEALEAATRAAEYLSESLSELGFGKAGKELWLLVEPSKPWDKIKKTMWGPEAAEFHARCALAHVEKMYMGLHGELGLAARAMGVELDSMEKIEKDFAEPGPKRSAAC